MYIEENLYNLETEEFVCSNHISDKYITNEILTNGISGVCKYCDEEVEQVVELSLVLQLIINGIDLLFEDPVESRNLNSETEYGYDGPIYTFYDLWWEDLLELEIEDSILTSDIEKYLENTSLYCYKDEYVSEPEYMILSWEHFKEIVKHRARYVFHFENQFNGYNYAPLEILDKIQKLIISLNLIETIPERLQVYRCRQHIVENEIKSISDLASAPNEYCKSNGRMNAAGVSLFYCSVDRELTIKEVVDSTDVKKPFFSTGVFESKHSLKLLNLSTVLTRPSIFDIDQNRHIDSVDFFNSFITDITQPVKSEDSIIEYIPTQIVTEYLRFNPKLDIDGIIYPSSKDPDSNNIVLFFDNAKSIDNFEFDMANVVVTKIIST